MAVQPGGSRTDLRFAPGQHDVAGDRDRRGIGAEVARDGKCRGATRSSARLVVVDFQVVQPRIGQVGFALVQRDQVAVDPL